MKNEIDSRTAKVCNVLSGRNMPCPKHGELLHFWGYMLQAGQIEPKIAKRIDDWLHSYRPITFRALLRKAKEEKGETVLGTCLGCETELRPDEGQICDTCYAQLGPRELDELGDDD